MFDKHQSPEGMGCQNIIIIGRYVELSQCPLYNTNKKHVFVIDFTHYSMDKFCLKKTKCSCQALITQSVLKDLRIVGSWFEALAWPIFFLSIDDSHCNKIHSSLTAVHCFDNIYVGKQLVA